MNETASTVTDGSLSLPPARRRRWIPVVAAIVLFLSGAVAGAGGSLLFVRSRLLQSIHHPREAPARITAMMRRHLSLNEDQSREVLRILQDRQAHLEAIRREVQPRVEAELDLVASQVGQVLNERQRGKWLKRFAALRQTWLPQVPDPAQ